MSSLWNQAASDFLSMMLVGALWGCTNPLLRKGSVEVAEASVATKSSSLKHFFKTFLNARVWLPYALNQSGSVVFYILLKSSNLSLAVPVCNAMALVFSFVTSMYLGERINKPLQTLLGASLILLGVAICVAASASDENDEEKETDATTTDDGMRPEL